MDDYVYQSDRMFLCATNVWMNVTMLQSFMNTIDKCFIAYTQHSHLLSIKVNVYLSVSITETYTHELAANLIIFMFINFLSVTVRTSIFP